MPTKRTTMLLDTEMIARAAETLGTHRATDTVRASLEQTVRQAHVRSLLAWELPEAADETLAEQRAPASSSTGARSTSSATTPITSPHPGLTSSTGRDPDPAFFSHYGLLHNDFSPKPAADVFTRFASGGS